MKQKCILLAAFVAITALPVAGNSVGVLASAGSCNVSGILCTSRVGYSGLVSGGTNDTYQFGTSDQNLSNNSYTVGGSVNDNVIAVRNRLSFARGCGYRDAVDSGGTGGGLLWDVSSAANGFVSVQNLVSSIFLKFGSGSLPGACGVTYGS